MDKYINFVVNNPIKVIIAIVFITILAATGLPKLEFDNSTEVMMPKNDSEYLFYQKIQDIYGNSGRFILIDIFKNNNNLWNHETFIEIDNLVTDLEEYKDFDKELEDARLEKFNISFLREEIRYSDLLDKFSDDASFQRSLKRKISKLFGKIDILTKDDLRRLKKEILIFMIYNGRMVRLKQMCLHTYLKKLKTLICLVKFTKRMAFKKKISL